MTAARLIAQLIELTPPPPPTESADELLAAAATMLDARKCLLATATELKIADVDDRQITELASREDAWRVAIARAQRRVGEHRMGAAALRCYGR